jgi:hypothetical protein
MLPRSGEIKIWNCWILLFGASELEICLNENIDDFYDSLLNLKPLIKDKDNVPEKAAFNAQPTYKMFYI